MSLLSITDLSLTLTSGSRATLLDQVSLYVNEGETVGLVGESGSGKSLTARAALGLLPARSTSAGSVLLDGTEVLACSPIEILTLRH